MLLDGSKSQQADVISGVPQTKSSVHCCTSLLLTTSQNWLKARISAFLLMTACCTKSSTVMLTQKQFNKIFWPWKNGKESGKCSSTQKNARSSTITNKRFDRQKEYRLHGHTLEVVDNGKYLGVTISNDLSWHRHVDAVAAKASRTLGFLRRNLGQWKSRAQYTPLL